MLSTVYVLWVLAQSLYIWHYENQSTLHYENNVKFKQGSKFSCKLYRPYYYYDYD